MPTKKLKVVPNATRAASDVAFPIAIARALDSELEWFFTYAEGAMTREGVSMLPSYLAGRMLGDDAEAATIRRAIDLATAVKATLQRLPPIHASVLRAMYTPRTWPRPVERAFKELAPIAVRLFCASQPWPARTAHRGLEAAVARELASGLAKKLKPRALRRTAARVFGRAVKAYASTRAVA